MYTTVMLPMRSHAVYTRPLVASVTGHTTRQNIKYGQTDR
jgi:hypothetical protein